MAITVQIGTCLSDLKTTIKKDTSLSDNVKTKIFNFIDNDKDDQITHSVEKSMFEQLLKGAKNVKLHIKDIYRNWDSMKNVKKDIKHEEGIFIKQGKNTTPDGGKIKRTRESGSNVDDYTRLSYDKNNINDEFYTDEDGNIICRRTLVGNKLYIDKDLDGVYEECQDWF